MSPAGVSPTRGRARCSIPGHLSPDVPTSRDLNATAATFSIPGRGARPGSLPSARGACQGGTGGNSAITRCCETSGSRIESQFETCSFASTTTCWKLSSPAQHGPRVEARGPQLFRRVAQGVATLGRGASGRAGRDGGGCFGLRMVVLLSCSPFSRDFVQLVPLLGNVEWQGVR